MENIDVIKTIKYSKNNLASKLDQTVPKSLGGSLPFLSNM